MTEFTFLHRCAARFGIPVGGFARSAEFHAAVLAIEVGRGKLGEFSFYVVGHEDCGSGGCLAPDPDPSERPPQQSFAHEVEGRIRVARGRMERRGGRIVEEIQRMEPYGFREIVLDDKRNRVALLSNFDG